MIESASFNWSVPLIQAGVTTDRLSAVKIERTSCCRMRLTPNVASSVSKGPPVEETDDGALDQDAQSAPQPKTPPESPRGWRSRCDSGIATWTT